MCMDPRPSDCALLPFYHSNHNSGFQEHLALNTLHRLNRFDDTIPDHARFGHSVRLTIYYTLPMDTKHMPNHSTNKW